MAKNIALAAMISSPVESLHDRIRRTLKTELLRLLVPVKKQTPWRASADCEITLGGNYKGVRLQVGDSYYSVNYDILGSFYYIDGRGDLEAELQKARRALLKASREELKKAVRRLNKTVKGKARK